MLACPPLFLLHEAEEYRTALPWISDHASLVPNAIRSVLPQSPAFIGIAGLIFLVVFAVAAVIAIRSQPESAAWIVFAVLIVARLENAVLHVIESLVLMQYSPGVLTAVLLVLPLSLYLFTSLLRLHLIRRRLVPAIIGAAFIVQTVSIGAIVLIGSLS